MQDLALNPPASSLFFSTNDVTAGLTQNSNLSRTLLGIRGLKHPIEFRIIHFHGAQTTSNFFMTFKKSSFWLCQVFFLIAALKQGKHQPAKSHYSSDMIGESLTERQLRGHF